MTPIPGLYTTAEAAARLGGDKPLSHTRILAIAETYGWEGYKAGGAWFWAKRDVDTHVMRMEAQAAWRLLGIQPSQFATPELSDMDDVEAFPCPACGELAYSPAPGSKWDHMAACPSCGWIEREKPLQ